MRGGRGAVCRASGGCKGAGEEEEEEASEGRRGGLAGGGSWVGMAGNKAGLARLAGGGGGCHSWRLASGLGWLLCASLKKCLQLSFSRHCFAVVAIVFFLPPTLSARQCLLFPGL